ncbi:GATL10 [Symbiodinium necroappetens]|uniref:GATL10 protein n=1 Tax=Symbiodinium necroappetens TaxID=1628268 RepID=A0A812QN02_9DINO|nr:GATL10 [Symbiodinium necroappetens]
MIVRLLWVLTLAGLALTALFLTFRHLHFKPLPGDGAAQLTHVVLSIDDSELRPLAVAIHSAWVHAENPDLVQFHVITSPHLQQIIAEQLSAYLPEARVQVHANDRMLKKLSAFVTFRASSQVLSRDSSIFHFVRFFLPEFLGRSLRGRASRLVYLDPETVVLGDISNLAEIDLKGTPLAAARSCHFQLSEILEFDLLQGYELPGNVKPQDCALSPALMVIDSRRWQAENVSGKILTWLQRYRDQPLEEVLLHCSMTSDRQQGSTGPLTEGVGPLDEEPDHAALDAVAGRIRRTGSCLGVCGFGVRGANSPRDKDLAQDGLYPRGHGTLGPGLTLQRADLAISPSGRLHPALHLCTAGAKLLHFSGPDKPWLFTERSPSLCAWPEVPAPHQGQGWSRAGEPQIALHCAAGQERRLVNCSSLWWVWAFASVWCRIQGQSEQRRATMPVGRIRRRTSHPPQFGHAHGLLEVLTECGFGKRLRALRTACRFKRTATCVTSLRCNPPCKARGQFAKAMRRRSQNTPGGTVEKTLRLVRPWLLKGAVCLVVLILAALVLAPAAKGWLRRQSGLRKAGSSTSTDSIHVCLTSDSADLRAAAVAIQSAWTNAASPDRLIFHLITTTELESPVDVSCSEAKVQNCVS